MLNMSGVGVGDVLVGHRTLKVTYRQGDYVALEDVESGQYFYVFDGEAQGSWTFEVIKKAKRKYKVGDWLTGKEICDHRWKRGTTIRFCAPWFSSLEIYTLRANGEWTVSNELDVTSASFDLFKEWESPDFEIVYLP